MVIVPEHLPTYRAAWFKSGQITVNHLIPEYRVPVASLYVNIDHSFKLHRLFANGYKKDSMMA
jgi:hypothetical protein